MLVTFMKTKGECTMFLNTLNMAVKSRIQEIQAKRSMEFYRKEAKTLSCSLEINDIAVALKKRLLDRGMYPSPKSKGELHIFLCFSLNNWENILPIVLKPFGEVTVFQWESAGFFDTHDEWLTYRNNLNKEMLNTFRKAHSKGPIDVMIGYMSNFNTLKETLIEIGKTGVTIFNMSWDDKLYFNGDVRGQQRSLDKIVSSVDLNLTNAPESVIKYLVHGGLAMFWPEAAHPDIHKSYDLPFEYDVSFVGQKYGRRPKFIARLRKMGINVACFGNGWENGPLPDEKMVELYSRSRINLGFAGVGYSRKLMCLKGRDFEVPMSGGLYLTQDNPELALVYHVGKEIVTYKDEKDCFQKIKRLLANPDEADGIRKAGRKRVFRDHTWEKRFSDIFRIAGLLLEDE